MDSSGLFGGRKSAGSWQALGWRLTLERDPDYAYRCLARRVRGRLSSEVFGLAVVALWAGVAVLRML